MEGIEVGVSDIGEVELPIEEGGVAIAEDRKREEMGAS